MATFRIENKETKPVIKNSLNYAATTNLRSARALRDLAINSPNSVVIQNFQTGLSLFYERLEENQSLPNQNQIVYVNNNFEAPLSNRIGVTNNFLIFTTNNLGQFNIIENGII